MQTELSKKLGVEHAIFGFTPFPAVAAAISRAGGFGVLGAVRYTAPDDLERDLDWIEAHVDGKPYGLDVVMPAKKVEGVTEADVEAMIPEGHRAVRPGHPRQVRRARTRRGRGVRLADHRLDGAGRPQPARRRLRLPDQAAGQRPRLPARRRRRPRPRPGRARRRPRGQRPARPQARGRAASTSSSPRATRRAATPARSPPWCSPPRSSTPSTRCPCSPPAASAADEQIAAALALGAQGVWLGSLWLTTAEADLHSPALTRKLLAAGSGDTVRSRALTGKPARQLRTEWTDAWDDPDGPARCPMPLQGLLVAEAVSRIQKYEVEPLLGTPVGQIVGRMNCEPQRPGRLRRPDPRLRTGRRPRQPHRRKERASDRAHPPPASGPRPPPTPDRTVLDRPGRRGVDRRTAARRRQPARPRAARRRTADAATPSPSSCPTASSSSPPTSPPPRPASISSPSTTTSSAPRSPGSSPTPAPRCSSPTSGSPTQARAGRRRGAAARRATGTRSARSTASARTPNSSTDSRESPPDDRTLGWVMNYTSGTTGRPRGIRRPLPGKLARGGVPRRLPRHLRHQAASTSNVHLVCSPLYHTAVLQFAGASLHIGHRLVLMDKWTPEEMLRAHRRPQVHAHPHGPDPVPPPARAARARCGRATTSRPCGTPSTAPRPAPTM